MKVRILRALAPRPLLAFVTVLALGLALLVGGLGAAQAHAATLADIQDDSGRCSGALRPRREQFSPGRHSTLSPYGVQKYGRETLALALGNLLDPFEKLRIWD